MRTRSVICKSELLSDGRIVSPEPLVSNDVSRNEKASLESNLSIDTTMPGCLDNEQINILKTTNLQLLQENYALKYVIASTRQSMSAALPNLPGVVLHGHLAATQTKNPALDPYQLQSVRSGIGTSAQIGTGIRGHRQRHTGFVPSVASNKPVRRLYFSNTSSDSETRLDCSSNLELTLDSLPEWMNNYASRVKMVQLEPSATDFVPHDSVSYFGDVSSSPPCTFSPVKRKTLRRIIEIKNRSQMKSPVEVPDSLEKMKPIGKLTRSKTFTRKPSFSSADETENDLPVLRSKRKKGRMIQSKKQLGTNIKQTVNDPVSRLGEVSNVAVRDANIKTNSSENQIRTLDGERFKKNEIAIEMNSIISNDNSSWESKHSGAEDPIEVVSYLQIVPCTDKLEGKIQDSKLNEDQLGNCHSRHEKKIVESNFNLDQTTFSADQKNMDSKLKGDRNGPSSNQSGEETLSLIVYNDGSITPASKLEEKILYSVSRVEESVPHVYKSEDYDMDSNAFEVENIPLPKEPKEKIQDLKQNTEEHVRLDKKQENCLESEPKDDENVPSSNKIEEIIQDYIFEDLEVSNVDGKHVSRKRGEPLSELDNEILINRVLSLSCQTSTSRLDRKESVGKREFDSGGKTTDQENKSPESKPQKRPSDSSSDEMETKDKKRIRLNSE